MEMFHAYGFAERVLKEACWINETTFWKPDDSNPKTSSAAVGCRTSKTACRRFPHVILNQARVHDCFSMSCADRRQSSNRTTHGVCSSPGPTRPRAVGDHAGHRQPRALDSAHKGEIETVKARYVVGCDGARSIVRQSIGRELHGDSANHAWGVMDVLAVTDFPDIRFKSLIQSAHDGSLLVIPREGGYLVRLYVEFAKLEVGERVANRNITVDDLIAKARRILNPIRSR